MILQKLRQRLADWIAPELQEKRNTAERLINVDELTGIANRRAYNAAELTAESEAKVFVMIDGDSFGKVNKEVGTHAGDKAIILLANTVRLGAKLAGTTRFFRLGGDEFAVIVNNEDEARTLINFVEGFYNYEPIRFGHIQVGATAEHAYSLQVADYKMQLKKKYKKTPETA